MGTQPYRTQDGKRVPGVTTILSRFKESGGLLHWAWEQGRDGKDYRESRDAAADAGTCAHAMVEADIYGASFDAADYPEDILSSAKGAFDGYSAWKNQTKLQVVESEVPLVSEVYAYGGTMDAVSIHDGLALLDWKTSNGVHVDYVLQLAAYGQLWNEAHPDRPLVGGYHLIRFGKPKHLSDPVSFEHRFWSSLDIALEQFIILRKAYELDKRVKGLI